MSARDDYPLTRLRSAPSVAAEQYERMCDEIDKLRGTLEQWLLAEAENNRLRARLETMT